MQGWEEDVAALLGKGKEEIAARLLKLLAERVEDAIATIGVSTLSSGEEAIWLAEAQKKIDAAGEAEGGEMRSLAILDEANSLFKIALRAVDEDKLRRSVKAINAAASLLADHSEKEEQLGEPSIEFLEPLPCVPL